MVRTCLGSSSEYVSWSQMFLYLQSYPYSRWNRHDWAASLSLSCIGEGNGNPLQCSCLENPKDGGAWWAAVYGVTQSPTRLKHLSSSSLIKITIPHILMIFAWLSSILMTKKNDIIYNYFIVLKICWTLNLDLVTRAAWFFVSSVSASWSPLYHLQKLKLKVYLEGYVKEDN